MAAGSPKWRSTASSRLPSASTGSRNATPSCSTSCGTRSTSRWGKRMSSETPFGSCPLPVLEHKHVLLGHGSGGLLTAQLVEGLFLPAFDNPILGRLDDQAVLDLDGTRLAFT